MKREIIKLAFFLFLSNLFSTALLFAGEKADLELLVTPLKVEKITQASVSDAVENVESFLLLRAIVHFRIEKILRGKLDKIKVEPPSKTEQFKDALKDKDVLKILTSDYQSAGSEFDRQLFRVAVVDPYESFGISTWENPEPGTYKIYLKHYKDEKDTFVMIRKERTEKVH